MEITTNVMYSSDSLLFAENIFYNVFVMEDVIVDHFSCLSTIEFIATS